MTEPVPAPPAPPLLSIVRGNPTAEQLAALTAVVAARAAVVAAEPAPAARPLWSVPRLRGALHAGPSAWRASGLPG